MRTSYGMCRHYILSYMFVLTQQSQPHQPLQDYLPTFLATLSIGLCSTVFPNSDRVWRMKNLILSLVEQRQPKGPLVAYDGVLENPTCSDARDTDIGPRRECCKSKPMNRQLIPFLTSFRAVIATSTSEYASQTTGTSEHVPPTEPVSTCITNLLHQICQPWLVLLQLRF